MYINQWGIVKFVRNYLNFFQKWIQIWATDVNRRECNSYYLIYFEQLLIKCRSMKTLSFSHLTYTYIQDRIYAGWALNPVHCGGPNEKFFLT